MIRGERWCGAMGCATAAVLLAVLGGCATSTYQAPVVEQGTPVGDPPPARYVVQPRDSLYAISWRYGLDYVAVARWNGIGPPYTIHPGQTLVLSPGGRQEPAREEATGRADGTAATRAPSTPPTRPADRASRRTVTPTAPVVRAPRVPAGVPETVPDRPPPRTEAATPTPAPAAPQPAARTSTAVSRKPAASNSGARWRWPVDVQPQRGFDKDNKGVDYAVPTGGSVVVAAPGQVVYAGPGLAGFRHLVIVEHGGGYLSAYSLNADPEVGEGAALPSGAQLAAIGGTSATDRKFHFEIRRNGSPVDPGRVIGR